MIDRPAILLSGAQVRAIDRLAMERLGLAGVVLMENAGRSAVEAILSWLGEQRMAAEDQRFVILCGGGNNGGDGYVVARHLCNRGLHVAVLAARPPDALSGDAAINAQVWRKMGQAVELMDRPTAAEVLAERLSKATVIVDCLLGTGFKGPVREPMDQIIKACNLARRRGSKVVAIDIPSGLDCDSGEADEATIQADLTVTFVAVKKGFITKEAQRCLGRVVVGDIGVPGSLVEEVARLGN
ncbi:MAG: NAD(P)H-hydrate epimerase [Phycisphaeraceae bacterium]|nr:NAD(P)H-hydrate epimerase [Phycisphaeraceae bacterium]